MLSTITVQYIRSCFVCYICTLYKYVVFMLFRRLFVEERRELYICCQESTSNNIIEMAFKLLFGWPG